MKKIYLLVAIAFLLTSCTSPLNNQENKISQQEQNKEKKTIGNAFKNAFTSGKAMRCTYLMNDTEVETLIKGNKTRVNGMGFGQGEGGMINDGEWVYIWNEGDKVGTKYNIAEMKAMNEEEASQADNYDQVPKDMENPEEWAAKMDEQFDVKCENANIADEIFTPPSYVAFSDMGEYMKKANEFKSKFEGKTEFDEKDLNEMNDMMEGMGKMYGGNNQDETEEVESEE